MNGIRILNDAAYGLGFVPPELLAKSEKLQPPVEYPQLPNWKPRWCR